MSDPLLRDGLIARFVEHGSPPSASACVGKTSRHEHLAMFSEIDIALDPFPQNGGISTWEPLHMGVPVVAKLGVGPAAPRAARSSRRSAFPTGSPTMTTAIWPSAAAPRRAAGGTRRAARAPAGPRWPTRAAGNCEVYNAPRGKRGTERSGATIAPGQSA